MIEVGLQNKMEGHKMDSCSSKWEAGEEQGKFVVDNVCGDITKTSIY